MVLLQLVSGFESDDLSHHEHLYACLHVHLQRGAAKRLELSILPVMGSVPLDGQTGEEERPPLVSVPTAFPSRL